MNFSILIPDLVSVRIYDSGAILPPFLPSTGCAFRSDTTFASRPGRIRHHFNMFPFLLSSDCSAASKERYTSENAGCGQPILLVVRTAADEFSTIVSAIRCPSATTLAD